MATLSDSIDSKQRVGYIGLSLTLALFKIQEEPEQSIEIIKRELNLLVSTSEPEMRRVIRTVLSIVPEASIQELMKWEKELKGFILFGEEFSVSQESSFSSSHPNLTLWAA